MPEKNPCLTCGTCCAHFRVSLVLGRNRLGLGAECSPRTGRANISIFVRKGTNNKHPRCVALQGVIDNQVNCLIYNFRPTACRDFAISGQNNQPNNLCEQTRKSWKLRPLISPASGKTRWPIKRKRRGVLRS